MLKLRWCRFNFWFIKWYKDYKSKFCVDNFDQLNNQRKPVNVASERSQNGLKELKGLERPVSTRIWASRAKRETSIHDTKWVEFWLISCSYPTELNNSYDCRNELFRFNFFLFFVSFFSHLEFQYPSERRTCGPFLLSPIEINFPVTSPELLFFFHFDKWWLRDDVECYYSVIVVVAEII